MIHYYSYWDINFFYYITDEEISEEDEEEVDDEYNSGEEVHDDSKIIDYDSEENEVGN